MSKTAAYRADIDGIRALAVVLVILFHAHPAAAPGGFIGVDVFFVISGYLITGVIYEDLEADRFSLIEFYERRIRRIFPALIAMIAGCLLIGWWVLLPTDYASFGDSILATTVFSSNLFFLRKSGYFDSWAATTPLLHTWSLAVEEQYYVAFPVFLALAQRRLGRRSLLLPLIAALAAGSFALAAWSIGAHAKSAFYLAPTRAWELLLGSLVYFNALRPFRLRLLREMGGVLGLALVVGAGAAFSETTPTPGPTTLAPCLGAALLLQAGKHESCWANRVLAWPALVFIGKISYSLYLWHWPLLVLCKHFVAAPELPLTLAAPAILASLVLATLSWRLVETPFRDRQRISRKAVFAAGLSGMATLALAGAALSVSDGVPWRFPSDVRELLESPDAVAESKPVCIKAHEGQLCELGAAAESGEVSFAVLGDSHALALAGAISEAARLAGRSGLALLRWDCPPFLAVTPHGDPGCKAFNDQAVEKVALDSRVRTVIVVARWALWAEGRGSRSSKRIENYLTDATSRGVTRREEQEIVARGLRRTVDRVIASGKRVVLLGPIPEIDRNVPKALATQRLARIQFDFAPRLDEFLERQAFPLALLNEISSETGAKLVLLHTQLCRGERCAIESEGKPLYRDDNHVTSAATPFLLESLREALAE